MDDMTIKTFEDLVFKPHPCAVGLKKLYADKPSLDQWIESMCNATQARLDFPNGYGISVLCGSLFYSNGRDTYEVGVFYKDRFIQGSVIGWQTKEEVTKIMIEVQELRGLNQDKYFESPILDIILEKALKRD